MFKNSTDKCAKEIIYCLITAILSMLAAFIFLGFYKIDWQVPINYCGDAFGALTAAQNFITGSGRFLYPNMGAPGVVDLSFVPDICNIEYLMMWILSLFIKQFGLLVNVYYLLTFPAIAVCTVIAMRVLKISPKVSILGAVVYSLLPYHMFREESHLFLSTYTFIPLACVVILWIIRGELSFEEYKKIPGQRLKSIFSLFNDKMIFSIITCVLVGASNIYYTYFVCVIMLFAIIWSLIEGNNKRKIIAPIFLLALVSLVTLIGLIPYVISMFNGNASAITGTRQARDVELYALKLPQLILPIVGHRIAFFDKIRMYYENKISISSNENNGATLGILLSIGFVASFIIALRKNKKMKDEKNNVARECALLNIFIFLLGVTGGISSLIAYIIGAFRCYNRLSVLIGFFSLVIVGVYLDEFIKKVEGQWGKAIVLTLIAVVSLTDMTSPVNNVASKQNMQLFYSNKSFVESVEKVASKNGKVLEMPFVDSNNNVGLNKMGVYEQFYPFIHSKSLKWSYRAQSGSESEKWQKYITSKPMSETLKYLAAANFEGIYIDRFGYKDNEWKKEEDQIQKLTGVPPIVSPNMRMSYFQLKDYFVKINSGFSEEEKNIYDNYTNVIPIVSEDSQLNVSNIFGCTLLSGWSVIEPWGVWSVGHCSQLEFGVLGNKSNLVVQANVEVLPNPINMEVYVNGIQIKDYKLQNGKLEIPINKGLLEKKEHNIYKINIQLKINNPTIPGNGDNRLLGIGLKNYNVKWIK